MMAESEWKDPVLHGSETDLNGGELADVHDLPNSSKDCEQGVSNLENGIVSGTKWHNADNELQEDEASPSFDTSVKFTGNDGALSKVSTDDDINIEIEDCDLEPDHLEEGNHVKIKLNKYCKVTNVNKINDVFDRCDADFNEGMQFGRMIENIYFLDEEKLKEEHENDRQKSELMMGLDYERIQRYIDENNSYSNADMEKEFVSTSLNDNLENSSTEIETSDALQTESPFSYLPDELIVKIFAYLNTQELCRHVSPVCKKWRQIAKEPLLWKSIDFIYNPEMKSLDMLWVLRQAPLLRKLKLRGRTHITHAEVAILSEMCPMLTDLDLGFCDNLGCDMLRTLVENCQNVRKINVEGCNKIDDKCLVCLSKCKKLSHLNFSHCFFQDESLTYLADHLLQIVSLNLDGISWITDRGVSSLVSKHYNHLTELQLDGAEITDAAIRNLTRCKELQTLEISFCENLSDVSLVLLKDLEKLRELKLRKGSSLTKEGMSEFFRTAKLTNLRDLNLSECTCIDDSVVLEMAKCCGNHLTFLSLCWCWFITDTGLVSIVDHCGKLETLELLGIEKIKGVCLGRVPEEIPNLTFLDLRQCNKIVDSLIVQMIRRKPDLKVLNYYGEEFVHQ